MRKTIEIQMGLVTPAITSGADQKQAELRAAGIRGQLRYWFRILSPGYEREKEIFGGVGEGEEGRASSLMVRIATLQKDIKKSVKDGKGICGNQYDYILWPLRKTPKDPEAGLRGVLESQTVHLQITVKEKYLQDAWRAIQAFLLLGSIGSRSRRAYGSIFPLQVKVDGNLWRIPHTVEDLSRTLSSLFDSQLKVMALNDGVNLPETAIRDCDQWLRSYRCGSKKSGKPSFWGQNDHDVPFRNNKKVYRPVVGLPLAQRYSDGGNYQTAIDSSDPLASKGGANDRWASPVLLKVLPLSGKFYPIAIFIPSHVMPENTKLCITDKRSHKTFQATLDHDMWTGMMSLDENRKKGWGKVMYLLS